MDLQRWQNDELWQKNWKLEDKFDGIQFTHILLAKDKEADILGKLGSARSPMERLSSPTIHKGAKLVELVKELGLEFLDEVEAKVMVVESNYWAPFIRYVLDRLLLEDKTQAI